MVINYCILDAKHFIYLKIPNDNNNIDFLSYLFYLKNTFSIEENICSGIKTSFLCSLQDFFELFIINHII